MTAAPATAMPATIGERIIQSSLVRILLAALAVIGPVAVTMVLAQQIPDKSLRSMWPQPLAAVLCMGGYAFYVRKIEKRAATELSGQGAWREAGSGIGVGAALFLVTIGLLAACGSYQVTGLANWSVLAKPFAEMALVAVFEEILFRGVLFRMTERSLGTLAALIISSLIFASAHLPNAGITVLAVGVTFVAGLLLAAAWMATRRLWLAAGLHFAWNFTSDGVFSLPTSGHPAAGLIQGQLTGPDWLSGGAYGVEASVVTCAIMALATVCLVRYTVRRGHFMTNSEAREARV